MRLWSIHPRYLDPKGLVALWREALLARAVLKGDTRGYTQHPQLERFREHPNPHAAINSYLLAVHQEASMRGYRFDRSKLEPAGKAKRMVVTSGQLELEWNHLRRKLLARSPALLAEWSNVTLPLCHPLFRVVEGPVAQWERATAAG